MKNTCTLLLLILAASAVPATAAEDEAPSQVSAQDGPPFRYLLGVNLHNHVAYFGSSERKTRAAPLLALRLGRWQISNSSAGTLMGLGHENEGPGAATQLGFFGPVRLGLGLRVDRGRKSGDAASTAGLPDVRSTLRARLGASVAPATDWRLGLSWTSDALGRGGGSLYSADVSYQLYRSQQRRCGLGLSVQAGSSSYMRSYFGTAAYQPDAGLRDLAMGVNCNQIIANNWIVFGAAGVGRMLGPANQSPLTQKRDNYSVNIGLAWRSL